MDMLHKTMEIVRALPHRSLVKLKILIDELLAQEGIPVRVGELERIQAGKWTYVLQLVNCGKHSCKVCGGKTYAHGPYWYGHRRIHGKMTSKYIGRELKPIDSIDEHDDDESDLPEHTA